MNVDDRDEPVQPHPEKSRTLVRIFELYASGRPHLQDRWPTNSQREGHVYRNSQPRFHRTALSYILSNRFYIGELHRNGQVFEGRYRRLIDRTDVRACQDILNGRNRRTGTPDHPLGRRLLPLCILRPIDHRRTHPPQAQGRRRPRARLLPLCQQPPRPGPPTVRWKAEDLEQAIVDDLAKMRLASPEVADVVPQRATAAVTDLTAYRRQQATTLAKRKTELATMQDRLLNAYLAGTVEEVVYKAKSTELKAEAAKADETLAQLGDVDPARAEIGPGALRLDAKRRGNRGAVQTIAVRREILDAVCLNRTLSDVNLDAIKRKPFDVFAKGLDFKNSRGDWI